MRKLRLILIWLNRVSHGRLKIKIQFSESHFGSLPLVTHCLL